jgi:hypothetical protein
MKYLIEKKECLDGIRILMDTTETTVGYSMGKTSVIHHTKHLVTVTFFPHSITFSLLEDPWVSLFGTP